MNRIYAFLSFLLLLMPVLSDADNAMPLSVLQIRFDLETNRLIGKADITLPPGTSWTLKASGLTVTSVTASNGPSSFQRSDGRITVAPGQVRNVLTIEYEAGYASAQVRGREDGIQESNLVSSEGIVLIRAWYPHVEGLTKYSLSAIVPSGFEAVSEAEEITVKEHPEGSKEYAFVFDHPVEGINFVAGPYDLVRERHKDIDILTYFFPEDRGLAGTYREYTKKYLDMYEDLIGPFPFRRFAVVENVLPTGYSMPTFTLLGRDVVKLPFIVETSLGHEILHQWFGNSVYIDHNTGNWAEGLTTYLADHWYEELKGKGWEYRKQIMVSYQSYITAENDFSLKDFVSRTDKATAAVGYGKTAMVFHMLRRMLGEDVFTRSLKEFYRKNAYAEASWADVQKAFETVSGKDLDWFFRQWIDGKGALDFQIDNTLIAYDGNKTRVSFNVIQRGRKDRFTLPVLLKTDQGQSRKSFEIAKEKTSIEIETEGIPLQLTIDDNYDLFRRLAGDETAPVVSTLLGDKNRIFVLPKGKAQEDNDLSGFLKTQGFSEKNEEDLKHDDIKDASLLMYHDCALAKRLFANREMPEGDFSLVMNKNPYSKKSVIGLISVASSRDLPGSLQKITHYGKYSTLAFKGGRNVLKTILESDRGMIVSLSDETMGIAVPDMTPLSQMIEQARTKEIVYVGESHDRLEHHRIQLQVIRDLYNKNKKIAIGMEMFQQPFQKVLDDYIAGTIDEKTFLKKSEYFSRWGFDYNLYREILSFARANHIPIIALNIRKEIVSKVSKEGLEALGEDDRKEVPEQLDLSDAEYRDRLRAIFDQHGSPEGRSFDFFYQAQVLWDESMARNLNEFMAKNPGYQVVVLAGVGHMAFGSGIPKRAYRLNKKEYAIILNSEEVEKGIADYVLFPSPIALAETPKLGVQLREDAGVVVIAAIFPESAADKAGLRKDDIVLALDGEKIGSIEDVKIHLLYKKKGDTVVVRALRKRFLFGDKELEVTAEL